MRNRILQLALMALMSTGVVYATTCFNVSGVPLDTSTIYHGVQDFGTNSMYCKGQSCGQNDRCIGFAGFASVYCNTKGANSDCTSCLTWELYYLDFTPPEEVYWDGLTLKQAFTACGSTNATVGSKDNWYRCEAPGYDWNSYIQLWNTSCFKASGAPDIVEKRNFSS